MSTTIKPGEKIFKDYILKRPIGEGGYGRVYLVKSQLGKAFALKVLFRGVGGEKRGVDSVIKIRSNRLINVLDYGETAEGEFCVLMEYVKRNFASIVANGNLEEKIARHYFREILEGLKVLEKHRIIHRDIKPSNLFVQEHIIKIGDFGTAKFTSGDTSTKTKVPLSCRYSAPESLDDYYSFSVDRWAAGVIFFRMLTGVFPFQGKTLGALLTAIMKRDPDYSIVPDKYAGFFRRCFAKDRDHRFADAREMIRCFDETGSPHQIIEEYESRINSLEARLDEARSKHHINGDYIHIEGRDVAFAKDWARAAVGELEDEIEDLKQQRDEAGRSGKPVSKNEAGKQKEIEKLQREIKDTIPGSPEEKRILNKIRRIESGEDSRKTKTTPDISETTAPEPAGPHSTIKRLRSEPKKLSDEDAREIIIKHGFFASDWNPSGDFSNDFTDNGDGTITDHATGLMWQQSGSGSWISFNKAEKYVEQINKDTFAGYSDWRLPTLEELASLLTPEEQSGLYIDPLFDREQRWCWTADHREAGGAVVVFFDDGDVNWLNLGLSNYARVVRSGQ